MIKNSEKKAPFKEKVINSTPTTAAVGDKLSGSCIWFDARKGIGYVTSDKGDFFVHQSVIEAEGFRKLLRNETVDFEVAADEKGRNKATNVVRRGDTDTAPPAGGRGGGDGGASSRGGGGGSNKGRGRGRGNKGRGRGKGRAEEVTTQED